MLVSNLFWHKTHKLSLKHNVLFNPNFFKCSLVCLKQVFKISPFTWTPACIRAALFTPLCTVTPQRHQANLKSLQSPTSLGQKCESLCQRHLCALKRFLANKPKQRPQPDMTLSITRSWEVQSVTWSALLLCISQNHSKSAALTADRAARQNKRIVMHLIQVLSVCRLTPKRRLQSTNWTSPCWLLSHQTFSSLRVSVWDHQRPAVVFKPKRETDSFHKCYNNSPIITITFIRRLIKYF